MSEQYKKSDGANGRVTIRHAIEKINRIEQSAVIYVHPWEFDLKQPRIKELMMHHYYNITSAEKKFKRLLKDFKFTSIRAEHG